MVNNETKVINTYNLIEENIPELKDIDNSAVEYVYYNNWESRMKTIATKNLKKYHKTPGVSFIHSCLALCIICCHDDYIEINRKKYELIRKYLMSKEFIETIG